MATKYARAGGGNWTTDATWSTTSGGAADTTAPTAADDAVLDAASGNVTIDSGAVCRSLDCNGYTGTLAHNASATLTIGDGTAGAGNRALRFVAGMTYTVGNVLTSEIAFISTSSTQQTVTSGGKTIGYLRFYGAGGSWLCDSAVACTYLTFRQGTLDLSSATTVTCALFTTAYTEARTLTLGSVAFTCTTSGTAFDAATVTNLTVTANTATVTLTGTNAGFSGGTQNWNGLSVVATGAGQFNLGSANGMTLANFTYTGTAAKTNVVACRPLTVTGTFTITGQSAVNRVLCVTIFSLGTAATITAASVSLTNVDFRDITGAGAATWTGTSIGNALGNSGITFTTPVTCTHNAGAAGNWSTAANWDTGTVPLCHDTVVIPATTTGTLTNDMPRVGANISFASGYSGTFTNSYNGAEVYGSFTLVSTMTFSGGSTWNFYGRSNHTITSAGKTFAWTVRVIGPGGTYTLADALTSANLLSVDGGTFTDAGFSVTAASFQILTGGTTAPTLNATGTWTITGTGATPWTYMTGTVNASTATIVLSGATATDRTFAGGGKTYGTLTDSNTLGGKLTITGANTFGTINKTATVACTLALPNGVTTTITDAFNVNGQSGAVLTVNAA